MSKIVELLQINNIIVVGVIHDLNLAAKFADQLILIDQGKNLAEGNKREVLTKENIKTAYRLNPVLVEDAAKNPLYLFFE